jgi:hypothetical protein
MRASSTTGTVVLPLEGEELVDGGDSDGVIGAEAKLASARERIDRVCDVGSALRHDSSAGDLTIMHKAGKREFSSREGPGDGLHVAANLGSAGGIVGVPLQADAAPVGQGLETMLRRVLIHTHGGVTAGLDQSERAVSGLTRGLLSR